jgi:glucokinase
MADWRYRALRRFDKILDMVTGSASSFRHRLIVSCQASPGDAFYGPGLMARFAQAAVAGGAAGIRANGPDDVASIRASVSVPIIAIQKTTIEDGRILITPSFDAARKLVATGADMVALDCTHRGQRYGALERMRQIKHELGVPVLADIATVDEAVAAAEAGADFILSTMRGYTERTKNVTRFEPSFIAEVVKTVSVPVIAEGRIATHEEARAAIRAGAFAVIIGSAVTRPHEIARGFASAIESESSMQEGRRYFLGIDMGGTNTKSGLVSSDGTLLFENTAPTPAREGRAALLENLKQVAEAGLDRARATGFEPASIGIATAGWVNPYTGVVVYATDTLPGWTGAGIAETIARHTGMPVSVENDANATAIAEKEFGIGRSAGDFVCLTLGTGVGGGCFTRNELNRGAHFFGNALGHIVVEPDGLPCNCGQRGCLEVYANAAALVRHAGGKFSSAADVISAANEGDTAAMNAVEILARYLARGCAILVQVLDPELVIFSGGLAQNNPRLVPVIESELSRLVPQWEQRNVRLAVSELGYHMGVLGAAALAKRQETSRLLPHT